GHAPALAGSDVRLALTDGQLRRDHHIHFDAAMWPQSCWLAIADNPRQSRRRSRALPRISACTRRAVRRADARRCSSDALGSRFEDTLVSGPEVRKCGNAWSEP